MSGNCWLIGLNEHLKLAREYAVEGLYGTSLIFFDGAVAQINSVEDPLVRAKWMNVKKALCEETEVVKKLDAQRRAFKETTTRSAPSSRSQSSSFVFQPLDDYPTNDYDPDVWSPPSPDHARRPARPPTPRGAKPSSRLNSAGARPPSNSNSTGKKGKDNNNARLTNGMC